MLHYFFLIHTQRFSLSINADLVALSEGESIFWSVCFFDCFFWCSNRSHFCLNCWQSFFCGNRRSRLCWRLYFNFHFRYWSWKGLNLLWPFVFYNYHFFSDCLFNFFLSDIRQPILNKFYTFWICLRKGFGNWSLNFNWLFHSHLFLSFKKRYFWLHNFVFNINSRAFLSDWLCGCCLFFSGNYFWHEYNLWLCAHICKVARSKNIKRRFWFSDTSFVFYSGSILRNYWYLRRRHSGSGFCQFTSGISCTARARSFEDRQNGLSGDRTCLSEPVANVLSKRYLCQTTLFSVALAHYQILSCFNCWNASTHTSTDKSGAARTF